MSDNMYAGASVQAYPSGNTALSNPHSDVKGFLDYVGKFNTINFHAKDDDVREWRYNHEYDNWQDSLGMDSVRVFYNYAHSGTFDGVYVTETGRTWDNMLTADSTRMSFGDQRLRYLFLHGCDSLLMHDDENPWRTWHEPNKGARMIFGFDSLTWDFDGLGSGFFREWNKGKSFSQAWQDAGLALSRDHRPASTACGATAEEAQNRLWNERFFDGGAVSDNWYWWRWAGPTPIVINLDIPLPLPPKLLRLARRRADQETAASLAERFGVRPFLVEAASPLAEQGVIDFEPRLVLLDGGGYEVFLAEPDRTASPVDIDEIRAKADEAVRSIDGDLTLERITATFHAGISYDGETTEPAVADFTAHYRQLYDATPAVVGGDGQVSVVVDAAGTVCSLTDTTVPIEDAVDARPIADTEEIDVESALAIAEAGLRDRLCLHDASGAEITVVPGSTEVGYRMARDTADLVARRGIEVRNGRFAMRYIVETTL